jgi:molybdopterin-guanine dinucleotide biosynthesis protein A
MSAASRDSDLKRLCPADVTGIILAGGLSTRYGADKALAEIRGLTLVERIVRVMTAIFRRVILITNTPNRYRFLNLPMYEDLVKGIGPLGGIYTGLKRMEGRLGFVAACDMPFLNPDLVRHMVAIQGDFDAVVPKMDWKIEALHALYSKSCLPAIEKLIGSRQYQVFKFFSQIDVCYINEAEIRLHDPDLRSFYNINDPQQWQDAVRLADENE